MLGRTAGSLGERGQGSLGTASSRPPWREDGVSLKVAAAGPPEGGDVQPPCPGRGVSAGAPAKIRMFRVCRTHPRCPGRWLLQPGGDGFHFTDGAAAVLFTEPHRPPGRRENCQGSWLKCKPQTSEMKPGSCTRASEVGPRTALWGNLLCLFLLEGGWGQA